MAAGIENLNVYSEYMNMLLIDNDTLATEFKRRLFANYREHPPRMLLLIGNPAKILLEDVKNTGATFRSFFARTRSMWERTVCI